MRINASKRLRADRNVNDMRNNPVFRKCAAICKRHGYELLSLYLRRHEVNISITAINSRGYHPEIYFDGRLGQAPDFRIGTVSYGFLDLDEYEEFSAAVQDAYDCATELKAVISKNLDNIYYAS